MHKGLYWTQLFTGIGVGLIIAALALIVSEQVLPTTDTHLVQPTREIVYYDTTDLSLKAPSLVIPELPAEPEVVAESAPVKSDSKFDLIEEDSLSNITYDDPEPKAVQKATPSDAEVTEFIIEPGDSADIIANNLKEQGIIQSEEEFLSIVRNRRLDRKLRAGSYLFYKGMGITDFVNELIR